MAATVHLVASDPALCRVLKARLEREADVAVVCRQDGIARVPPGTLVLSTSSDIVPAQVARLSAGGAKVIILAAIPRESDAASYVNAGAIAYIVMTIKIDELLQQIRAAMAQPATHREAAGPLRRGVNGLQGIAG